MDSFAAFMSTLAESARFCSNTRFSSVSFADFIVVAADEALESLSYSACWSVTCWASVSLVSFSASRSLS